MYCKALTIVSISIGFVKMPVVLKRTKKQDRLDYVELVYKKATDLESMPTLFGTRLRSLVSKLHPYRLNMKPSKTSCASLRMWILIFEEGRQRDNARSKLLQLKEPLDIHPELLHALDYQILDGFGLDDASRALQEDALEAFPRGSRHRAMAVGVFVTALFELRKADAVHDLGHLSRCGDVRLATAVDFCIPWKRSFRKYNIRVQLLERTGFRHSACLAEQLQLAWQCEKELPWEERLRMGVTIAMWLRLWWLLGQSPQAASDTMSVTDITVGFCRRWQQL